MIVVIDTDALLALLNTSDALHANAISTLTKLARDKAAMLVLPTTLCEFALVATSRIGMKRTKTAVRHILQATTPPLAMLAAAANPLVLDSAFTRQAVALYQQQTAKEASLSDCYVMVAAKKVSAACIFSLDRRYSQHGFKLASEVV